MNNKIVLVGTGFVGTTMVFSMINSKLIDEIVLIDTDNDKAVGEEIDLLNSEVLIQNDVNIHAGTYEDCTDAKIVIITAGVSNKNAKSRLELVNDNSKIIKNITENVINSGFNGIFLVASNPVDIMAYVIKKVSGFDDKKVIGTGTLLDTARLKYVLSEKYEIDSKNIEGYVIAEHGDSSVIPWEYVKINNENINLTKLEKEEIHKEVINMGYDISSKKHATYYGIAMCLNKIVEAILEDKNELIPVSTYLEKENLYTSVPCIINKNGIKEKVILNLNDEDKIKFNKSCNILKEVMNSNNI